MYAFSVMTKKKNDFLSTFRALSGSRRMKFLPSTKCDKFDLIRKCWKTFVPVFMFIKKVTRAFCLSSYFDGSGSSLVAFFHSSFWGSL